MRHSIWSTTALTQGDTGCCVRHTTLALRTRSSVAKQNTSKAKATVLQRCQGLQSIYNEKGMG